jgi:hypothetical protein
MDILGGSRREVRAPVSLALLGLGLAGIAV